MKKITLVVLVFFLIGIFSCKKSGSELQTVLAVDSTIIKSVNSWIESTKKETQSLKSRLSIDTNKLSISWNNIVQRKLDNGLTIIIADIPKKGVDARKGLFVLDRNLKTTLGTICTDASEKRLTGNTIEKALFSLYDNTQSNFSGTITFQRFDDKFLQENTYTNGEVTSISVLKNKSKEKSKTSSGQRVEGCTDWFWQTYINGQLVDEVYLFTTCDGDDDCNTTRLNSRSGMTYKVDCGGGIANTDPFAGQPDKLCGSTFYNFTRITSDGSSFALNIQGLKFTSGTQINEFDAYVNVQNYVLETSINTPQPSSNIAFMPPSLAGQSPMDIYQSLPVLNQLVVDGDIKRVYMAAEGVYAYSYSPFAYSVLTRLAADWAATNTFILAPNPAYNALAPSTYRAQFGGILAALIPGSKVRALLDPNVSTRVAVYDRTGNCL